MRGLGYYDNIHVSVFPIPLKSQIFACYGTDSIGGLRISKNHKVVIRARFFTKCESTTVSL